MESKDTSKEALNEICNECYIRGDCDRDAYGGCPNLKKVWNDLEILEILKNKRVNINKIIKVGKLENYNSICAIGTDLTFEEYKAIKNWLERKE